MKRIPGSAGVLLPGMEARIVRDDGSDADVNEVGELYLRGLNVAMGYWNNEKATRETFVDGWLRTGDKFRVDEEEYFLYVSFVSAAFVILNSIWTVLPIERRWAVVSSLQTLY